MNSNVDGVGQNLHHFAGRLIDDREIRRKGRCATQQAQQRAQGRAQAQAGGPRDSEQHFFVCPRGDVKVKTIAVE